MRNALNLNETATLSSVLLSTLEEGIFFGKLSGFVAEMFGHKVQIVQALPNGSTQLVAEDGKAVIDAQLLDKGVGISAYVIKTKRPYYSNALNRDPLFSQGYKIEGAERALSIPVISNGAVLATINIYAHDLESKFSEEDVNALLSLLKSIEAPISNMRMYLMAKHLNHELLKKIEDKENDLGKKENLRSNVESKYELIGHCSQFTKVMEMANKMAKEDFPILIEGEVGTGKKLLARKIHSMSVRRSSSIFVVDCQLEDQDVLASELFGNKVRKGALENANGGTIVLSEISALSIALQKKLLSVITRGEFTSSHSDKTVALNVRFICTSKAGLDRQVSAGEFSAELFHRLNTLSIRMPSLMDRKEDIKVIAEHFLNLNAKDGENRMFTSKAIERLFKYAWPGNVRELKNVIEGIRTLVDDRFIDEDHLPKKLKVELKVKQDVQQEFSIVTLEELEKRHIVKTLEHLGCNKTRAAKALGITVKTLYNKLHSYGLVSADAQ